MRRCKVLLGTFVEIQCQQADGFSKKMIQEAFDSAYSAIAKVDELMNIHKKDSTLSRINRTAPTKPVLIDPWIKDVLLIARDLHRESNGLFDCTYQPLHPKRPTAFDAIEWVDENHLHFTKAIEINLNGIAKGFAVDKAVEALENHGITSGIVNAGGDLRIFGNERYPVYVRNPINPLLINGIGHLKDIAVASSGNYLQTHLFNPESHSTVCTDSSFTVFAKKCVHADGLTKVLAALGQPNHPCFSQFDSVALILKP